MRNSGCNIAAIACRPIASREDSDDQRVFGALSWMQPELTLFLWVNWPSS